MIFVTCDKVVVEVTVKVAMATSDDYIDHLQGLFRGEVFVRQLMESMVSSILKEFPEIVGDFPVESSVNVVRSARPL